MMSSGNASPVGLPRQFLRPLLMIALTSGSSYGYELTERLHDQGLHVVDTAAIYRLLRALEHESLVESWWEISDTGPRRRLYELTETGHCSAEDLKKELITIRGLLDQVVGPAVGVRR